MRQWLADSRRVAAALLVETDGSAPLEPGATMLVDDHGRIEGSVTGGCVEAALADEAAQVLAGGGARLRTYGITASEAAGVGLMCGGTVQIMVHELGEAARLDLGRALAAADAGRPVAIATLVDGPAAGSKLFLVDGELSGGLGGPALLDRSVGRDLEGMLDAGLTAVRRYGAAGETQGDALRVFVQSFAPPPELVVLGANDFSAALARSARVLGWRVTIVDPREPFLASERFREAATTVVAWPGDYLLSRELTERDSVLVFSHDPKFDEPSLAAALDSGAGYVGALGSRRTHAERLERLRAAGVAEDDLRRISAPCGLDVGARTPAETAISILAEILALASGRGADRLACTKGPIHPRTDS